MTPVVTLSLGPLSLMTKNADGSVLGDIPFIPFSGFRFWSVCLLSKRVISPLLVVEVGEANIMGVV